LVPLASVEADRCDARRRQRSSESAAHDGVEQPVDDAAMEVHMAVEAGASAVDDTHRTSARVRRISTADVVPVSLLNEFAQDGQEASRMALRKLRRTANPSHLERPGWLETGD
jgi:hypothetical protein